MSGDQHSTTSAQVGNDGVVPVGQHPPDDILEAFRGGHLFRCQLRIPGVRRLRPLVVRIDRRWRSVIGTPPQHELLFAVLSQHLGLVLALQRTVVALVEAPMPAHWDPRSTGGMQRHLCGADRALEQRGVEHVGQDSLLGQHGTTAFGFGASLLGQVDVDPPGEQILRVPFALPVAEQDQGHGGTHGSYRASSGAHIAPALAPRTVPTQGPTHQCGNGGIYSGETSTQGSGEISPQGQGGGTPPNCGWIRRARDASAIRR